MQHNQSPYQLTPKQLSLQKYNPSAKLTAGQYFPDLIPLKILRLILKEGLLQ